MAAGLKVLTIVKPPLALKKQTSPAQAWSSIFCPFCSKRTDWNSV